MHENNLTMPADGAGVAPADAVSAAGLRTARGGAIAAAVIGNWLEFFDFTVYGFFRGDHRQAVFPVARRDDVAAAVGRDVRRGLLHASARQHRARRLRGPPRPQGGAEPDDPADGARHRHDRARADLRADRRARAGDRRVRAADAGLFARRRVRRGDVDARRARRRRAPGLSRELAARDTGRRGADGARGSRRCCRTRSRRTRWKAGAGACRSRSVC